MAAVKGFAAAANGVGAKKILLIRPAPAFEQFGDESFMPLGMAYIAAVLEKNGHEVRVTDLLVNKKTESEILETIASFSPSHIGFTVVTPVINPAYELCSAIREKFPNIVIIAGGPHASALPEECIENGFDFAVIGEGEETIAELINGRPLEEIKGIAYKKNGTRVKTDKREYITDLDSLPLPARHLFDSAVYKGQEALGSKQPVFSIMTSRGCPYSCTFCYKAVFGNKFRARSAESVVEEWVMLKEKYGAAEIAVVDDSFTTDPARVHKICDMLIERKVNVRWSCPNGIRTDIGGLDMLKKMKKAGCYRAALGIESGSQEILDKIGKRTKREKIEQMVKNCRSAGIRTMGFYMLGNPGETRKTMQETIDFAKKLGTDYAQFLLPIPYPGTKLYDDIKANGKIFITDWSMYGQYEGTASFSYGEVTPELLTEMLKKAEKEYYMNPGYILKQIFNLETYMFLPRRVKAALRVIGTAGKP